MTNVALSPRLWRPGLFCSICGTAIAWGQNFSWDHDPPVSKGGRGRRHRRLSHTICNSVKGCQSPFSLRTEEEREAIRAQVTPRTYGKLVRTWRGESI